MSVFTKDPDAVLDYYVDWSNWLGSDTIVASQWEVDDPGLEIDTHSYTTTKAAVWLSGGVDGDVYQVTNQITTAEGRKDNRSITIQCKEK